MTKMTIPIASTKGATQPIGIVLAGGLSSRMGTDKASLILDGESLLLRARRHLLETGCLPVIMSGKPRTPWPDQSVSDEIEISGPMSGIIACVNFLSQLEPSNQPLVFIPVDAPLLNRIALTRLLDEAALADACIYECNPLPLVIRLTRDVIRKIKIMDDRIKSGKSCSVSAFLKLVNTRALVPTTIESELLRNINTPLEWKTLQHELTH